MNVKTEVAKLNFSSTTKGYNFFYIVDNLRNGSVWK